MVGSAQRMNAVLGHLAPVPTVSYPFRPVTIQTAMATENSTRSEGVPILPRRSPHNFQPKLKGAVDPRRTAEVETKGQAVFEESNCHAAHKHVLIVKLAIRELTRLSPSSPG